MRQVLLSFFLLILSFPAFAEYTFLGFSEDGRYCAYTWEGFDQRRYYQLECRVLDVISNKYVGEHLKTRINPWQMLETAVDSDPDQFRVAPVLAHRALDSQITQQLRQYGIREGNIGDRVFFYSLQEKPVKQWSALKVHEADFHRLISGVEKKGYSLELEERFAYPDQRNEGDPVIFTLKLRRGKSSKILQKDRQLYNYRKKSFGYSISSVFVYRGKLVVILESITPQKDTVIPLIRVVPVTGDFRKEQK